MAGEPLTSPTLESDLLDADPYYIRAPSPVADERDLVLKQGDTFAVLDRQGDIRPVGPAEEGLYHNGTRFLSRLGLSLNRQRPLLLSSAVRSDNAWITVDLTNADVSEGETITVPRGTLHLSRTLALCDGVLYERFVVRNYSMSPMPVTLILRFDADFVDIFEVRGTKRARRGEMLPAGVTATSTTLGYRGLDGVTRQTRITLEPAPVRLAANLAVFEHLVPPQGEITHVATFVCEEDNVRRSCPDYTSALSHASESLRQRQSDSCRIVTSNQQFNEWLRRSAADLAMMVTDTTEGEYPYAGVPWFSTPFGRDGLITALECLWMNPRMARGVLSYLAATQATETRPEQDAQPGKILHEARSGEMAALGEIPFGRYYGSHDATPLFVMLAAAYYDRTADRDLIERLWPAIEAALHWMATDGDPDGDGFIEYARTSPTGLVQQGWKDSHDSVFLADGTLAQAPIALCEVQAYAYGAWRGAARLADILGRRALATEWLTRAESLRSRFEDRFWNPDLGMYVLALDGEKRQCAVRTSNAGHALFSGIAEAGRAAIVAERLLGTEMFSGWGVRTLATSESRYNPMSYHNGSIWPHDNAIVAAGLARYGRRDEVLSILSGIFDVSLFVDLHRLPELFCGFPRKENEGPTAYPVACSPQAWAAGTAFMLLQATLGLEINAAERVVRFTRSKLPNFLDEVRLYDLQIGAVTVDLALERHDDDVGIHVIRRQGDVEIVAIK